MEYFFAYIQFYLYKNTVTSRQLYGKNTTRHITQFKAHLRRFNAL